jgi:excisionase family DNA binding protein
MINVDHQEVLSVQDAARLLSISLKTLRTCVRQGRIRSLKRGRQVVFRYEDLGAFMTYAYPSTPSVRI